MVTLLAILAKLGITLNVMMTVVSLALAVLPRRPVFLMRTWGESWVEPARWLRAARGWISWYLRASRRRSRSPDAAPDPVARHDISNPCEELFELATRVDLGARLLAPPFDAADVATLRAAVQVLDRAARRVAGEVVMSRLALSLDVRCETCGEGWDAHGSIDGRCSHGGGTWCPRSTEHCASTGALARAPCGKRGGS